jgi:hypothetical protein
VRSDQVCGAPLLPAAAGIGILSVLGAHSAIEGESQAHATPLSDPTIRSRTASITCTSARLASRGRRYWWGTSISTPPSDIVGESVRSPRSEPACAVRDVSVIASTRRIPLFLAGLAAGLYQASAAGDEVLEGGGVDERAIAGGGVSGAVELPQQFVALLG